MKNLLRVVVSGTLFLAALALPGVVAADTTDDRLAEKVIDQIQRYPNFSYFDDISITVENRVVTLLGYVTRPIKKTEIGKRVARIDGIRELNNDIKVLPISPFDDDLRLRVARAIYNHPQFWQYAQMALPPIHIIVEGGRITLTGRVGTELERTLAFTLAQVPGSFSVKNELKLDRR